MAVPTAAASADAPKMQTSIDTNSEAPAMVRFRRWTAFGNTAYLRGQEAGFSLHDADLLSRRGAADIVHRASRAPVAGMVTK